MVAVKLDPGTNRAEVQRLQVSPKARRTGLGTALMSRLEAFCKAKRCPEVFLTTLSLHGKAVNLYKKMGYTLTKTSPMNDITLLHFHKLLANRSSREHAHNKHKRQRPRDEDDASAAGPGAPILLIGPFRFGCTPAA